MASAEACAPLFSEEVVFTLLTSFYPCQVKVKLPPCNTTTARQGHRQTFHLTGISKATNTLRGFFRERCTKNLKIFIAMIHCMGKLCKLLPKIMLLLEKDLRNNHSWREIQTSDNVVVIASPTFNGYIWSLVSPAGFKGLCCDQVHITHQTTLVRIKEVSWEGSF